MTQEHVLEVPLGSGTLGLTEAQANSLYTLYVNGSWPVLEHLLRGIQESAQVAMRDTSLTMDEIRVQQGTIQGVQLVAQTITDEVVPWYKSKATTE